MNVRRFAIVLGIAALCAAIVYRAGSAEPSTNDSGQESLEASYARVRLQMAEVSLEKAQQMNKKFPGTLPADLVAQYADEVTVAKALAQTANRSGGNNLLDDWLLRTELNAHTAKLTLANATKTEQRTPGTYEPIDIERLRLAAEFAQLQFDRGKTLVHASPEAKLQWVVDVVDDELLQLKKRSALLFQTRGPSDL